eukprot:TRINITY_DN17673_c0_g1_i1.p1 TRINITY_DN17673_c0_g1~~TRINITY_DN17673_c0_g1_i1.p1  ORF type:complete len:845 (+),score=163.48 TRINITY_DN17673_c0_g1_i1:65-2599(+)
MANADCKVRCSALVRPLQKAKAAWNTLESNAITFEDNLLCNKIGQVFRIEKADLADDKEGCLRSFVRCQLRAAVLLPLRRLMHEHVSWGSMGDGSCDRDLVAELCVERDRVAHMFDSPASEGVTKAEERGKKKCPTRDDPMCALNRLEEAAKRLNAFIDTHFGVESLATVVPNTVARSVCDWQFKRCVGDFEQLQNWWISTKISFSSSAKLWESLQSREGVFIRRVEKGLEELMSKKSRHACYADLGLGRSADGVSSAGQRTTASEDAVHVGGGSASLSPSLEAACVLAAQNLFEMREGLKQIRNSAMWRVIEAGRQLQEEMNETKRQEDASKVESITLEDGAAAVIARVDASGKAPSPGSAALDLDDLLLLAMQRLDCVIKISTEIREAFGSEGGDSDVIIISGPGNSHGIQKCMDDFASAVAGLQEMLLDVLDEPSADGVQSWLRLWSQWDGAKLARQIEDSLRAVFPSAGRRRREHSVLLRGLQALADGDGFPDVRARITSCLTEANRETTTCPVSEAASKEEVPFPQDSFEVVDEGVLMSSTSPLEAKDHCCPSDIKAPPLAAWDVSCATVSTDSSRNEGVLVHGHGESRSDAEDTSKGALRMQDSRVAVEVPSPARKVSSQATIQPAGSPSLKKSFAAPSKRRVFGFSSSTPALTTRTESSLTVKKESSLDKAARPVGSLNAGDSVPQSRKSKVTRSHGIGVASSECLVESPKHTKSSPSGNSKSSIAPESSWSWSSSMGSPCAVATDANPWSQKASVSQRSYSQPKPRGGLRASLAAANAFAAKQQDEHLDGGLRAQPLVRFVDGERVLRRSGFSHSRLEPLAAKPRGFLPPLAATRG